MLQLHLVFEHCPCLSYLLTLLIFQKMYCQQCLFLLQQTLSLISRINHVFIELITVLSLINGDYSNLKHFKKCNGTAGSNIQKFQKMNASI